MVDLNSIVSCYLQLYFPYFLLYFVFYFPDTISVANSQRKEKNVGKKTWKERTKALLAKELKNEYKRYGDLLKRNMAQCNLIR